MTESYQQAVQSFENKDYRTAEDILINLKLNGNGGHEVSYFLAVVKSLLGNYSDAENYYRETINLKPDHPEAYYNLALCLHNQNKNEEALSFYKKALEINPFLSEAHNNIAVIYKEMGKYNEAEAAFKKAVKSKPDNNSAISNLSGITLEKESPLESIKILELINEKNYIEAEKLLLNLIEKQPENIVFLKLLGIVYFNLKKYDKASEYYKKILKLNENDPESIYNLGVCCQYSEDNENALKYYKKTIELKPDKVDALNNLGLIYADLKNNVEAIKYYKLALKYYPEYTNTLINLGGIILNEDRFEEAMKYFDKALSIFLIDNSNKNQISLAYTNIGLVHYKLKNINEALKYFSFAIENNPENIIAHYNKAEALLIQEQYKEGWQEYEWRIDRKEFGKRKFKKKFEFGFYLKGKRVLVFAEQGFGDAIQFVKYLPLLKNKGCFVIFECSKEMHSIIREFEGIDEIIERNINKEPEIEYDYAIPLLSLPLYLKEYNPDTFSGRPYIKADEKLVNKWSLILNEKDKLKIGIIWAGSPTHKNDRHRSVKLRQFSSLFSIEGTGFYSLQKGIPTIQAKDYRLIIADLSKDINSFADTAAIIENMDIIITVDTSVAHLAGAMGKETWVLLPYVSDWRWGSEGERTVWYPSVKLYRQPRINDWDSVFLKLKKDIIEYINDGKIDNPYSNSLDVGNNKPNLYLGLSYSQNVGWGIVSKYFKKELASKFNIINFDEHDELFKAGNVNGTVLQILNNDDFSGLYPILGTKNIGYTVFEYELNDLAVKNASHYDIIIGASSWNVQKLNEKGVKNTALVIQGIDPELFYPEEKKKKNDLFVIFSGGKFELRKGQDLVLRAIKILQDKYPDIVLINAWYNMWPDTMKAMKISKHIKYEYKGSTWKDFMANLCMVNGIDGNRVFTMPLMPNNKLRELYLSSDVGLFPNRCEGGTNLVMMEYMACGKSVIASYNTGQKDILTDENSLCLKNMDEFKIYDDNKKLIADWKEPDIDEVISKLEYAYFNRDILKKIGKNAGEFMKRFTWKDSAESLMKFISA